MDRTDTRRRMKSYPQPQRCRRISSKVQKGQQAENGKILSRNNDGLSVFFTANIDISMETLK